MLRCRTRKGGFLYTCKQVILYWILIYEWNIVVFLQWMANKTISARNSSWLTGVITCVNLLFFAKSIKTRWQHDKRHHEIHIYNDMCRYIYQLVILNVSVYHGTRIIFNMMCILFRDACLLSLIVATYHQLVVK
jgi:hypothetical protein